MLSAKADNILTHLEESGDSQAAAVGECLRTIAENGEGQDRDKYLADCADEIASWATQAAKNLRSKKFVKHEGPFDCLPRVFRLNTEGGIITL